MTSLARYPSKLPERGDFRVATLGNFDGFHHGHQSILERVRAQKLVSGGRALLLSFYPHPAVVLRQAAEIQRISTLHQSLSILAKYQIDFLYLVRFTAKLAAMRAQDFIEKLLFEQLDIKHLVLGPDACVGRKREGDSAFIRSAFAAAGRQAEIVSQYEHANFKVGSRLIREALAGGNLDLAATLLGRRFALEGRIVHGAGRGKSIGIPTANLHLTSQVLPPAGVYATLCRLAGQSYQSVTNIGVRPTFEVGEQSVETHLLSYAGDNFYNQHLELEFVSYLRAEQKFSSVGALQTQIQKDIQEAGRVLGSIKI